MNNMDSPTYLAKNGKVFGPYEPEQVVKLKASGDFFDYEWMWDGQSPDWAPVPRKLKSPPPLPGKPQPQVGMPAQQTYRQDVVIETSDKTFCAIVFDSRQTLGGEVSRAHTRGARFVSTPSQAAPFSKGSHVWIDLLDEEKDRTSKIKSTIAQVSRMNDRWVIDLEWTDCPLL